MSTRFVSIALTILLAGCEIDHGSSDHGERRWPFATIDRVPDASRADVETLENTLLHCLAKAGNPDLVAFRAEEVVRRQGCVVENIRTKNCLPRWYVETVRWIALYPSTVVNPDEEKPLYLLQMAPRSQYYTNGYMFYDWSDPTQPLPAAARSAVMNLVNGQPAC